MLSLSRGGIKNSTSRSFSNKPILLIPPRLFEDQVFRQRTRNFSKPSTKVFALSATMGPWQRGAQPKFSKGHFSAYCRKSWAITRPTLSTSPTTNAFPIKKARLESRISPFTPTRVNSSGKPLSRSSSIGSKRRKRPS